MTALIRQLIRCGVPMIQHVETGSWGVSLITKRDKFYRMNGKIISRNLAKDVLRAGLARFEEGNQP